MKTKFILIVALCFVFYVGLVSSLGCCVGSGLDRCYPSSDEDSCSDLGGNFYSNDASCNSVESCDMGCCIVGLDALMMTRGKCQVETRASGFSALNFLQTNEDCSKFITSQDWGACIFVDSFGDKTCSYLTRGQCVGDFKQGVLCSSVSGNVACNKTTNTVCYNNDVYYIDSCGNRDALKDSCDFNSGTVCKQTDSSSSSSAVCKSVDCVDNFDFNKFVVNGSYATKPVYTQPITRKQGDVWCVTNGMVPYDDKYFGSENKSFVDIVFDSIMGLMGLGSSVKFSDSASSLVGNRFFSRYCINGDIITEPCDDAKEGYCSGESSWYNNISTGTGGQCDSNDWRGCLSAESKDECDALYCDWYDPADNASLTEKQMIADLKMGKCLPKVPGGLMIGGSKESICSAGNYETVFGFGFISEDTAFLKKDSKTKYGNAGLLVESPQNWYAYSASQLTYNPSTGQNLYVAPNGLIPSLFYGAAFIPIPLNKEVIDYLDYRCSRIADCSGKMNWAGMEGNTVDNGVETESAAKINSDLQTLGEQQNAVSAGNADTLHYYGVNTGIKTEGGTNVPIYSVPGEGDIPVVYMDYAQTGVGGNYEYSMINIPFKYECKPWKAPKNGSCDMCSDDGTPCTKYKCESLGSNCEYFDIENGMSGGKCMLKTDFSAPRMTINCPVSSSIKAQEPIKISVSTSETAQCRFSLGNAGASYETMSYDLGATWGLNHDSILTVPGTNKLKSGNTTLYPLLTSSGKFDVYIRCIDAAGNGDTDTAQLCSFDVPKTPDRNQPIVLEIDPKSGSAAEYNSSSKGIILLANEPVECRWSLSDGEFSLMTNSFSCINKLVSREDVNGYECSGDLDVNFGNNTAGTQKNYYIKCKDQPGLVENEEYKRNTNTQSTVYTLRASDKLEISDFGRKSQLVLGSGASNWTLSVKTNGGGYNGEAVCKWRLSFKDVATSYSEFMNTGGTVHTQTITQIAEGDYILDVKCTDKAGNVANNSVPLSLRYDTNEPTISRIFNANGNVKILTAEPAVCKFSNLIQISRGCSFPFVDPNLTLMTGTTNIEHSTNLKKGANYLIKCQDFYGNENGYCGIIAKFV